MLLVHHFSFNQKAPLAYANHLIFIGGWSLTCESQSSLTRRLFSSDAAPSSPTNESITLFEKPPGKLRALGILSPSVSHWSWLGVINLFTAGICAALGVVVITKTVGDFKKAREEARVRFLYSFAYFNLDPTSLLNSRMYRWKKIISPQKTIFWKHSAYLSTLPLSLYAHPHLSLPLLASLSFFSSLPCSRGVGTLWSR